MKHPLRHLLLSAALTLTPLGYNHALNTDLPDLGSSASSIMTPKQERELGQAFMRSVRRSQAVLDDPLINDYLQQLGNSLVDRSASAGQRFTFFVIDNPEINAFAGPAGHIGVYTGLILTTETESELAAVVAHEIAHVSQQHLMRAWETAQDMAIPNAAIMLAAIALGLTVGGDAGLAAAAGGQAAILQQQINFTRANEQEADRIGIDILAESGFEPRAMPAFFARMGKANRVYATEIPEFLLTHPVSTSRTADALDRAGNYAYTQPEDDLRYQLLRMHLQQKANQDPNQAVENLERLLREGRFRSKLATEYGRAQALSRAGRLAEADQALDQLLAQRPDLSEFVVSKARVETRLGKTSQALARLDRALLAKPGSYALNISYAETALAQGQYDKVLGRLQQYIDFEAQDPQIYKLMSLAAGEAGDTLAAHNYLAEHHFLSGSIEAAILQLEIALKTPGISFFDSAKVESRLKIFREEEEAQKNRE